MHSSRHSFTTVSNGLSAPGPSYQRATGRACQDASSGWGLCGLHGTSPEARSLLATCTSYLWLVPQRKAALSPLCRSHNHTYPTQTPNSKWRAGERPPVTGGGATQLLT